MRASACLAEGAVKCEVPVSARSGEPGRTCSRVSPSEAVSVECERDRNQPHPPSLNSLR